MKIKVCGMRDAQNIRDLIALNPEYIGFILWDKSPRYIAEPPQVDIPASIKKVGVFVNETLEVVLEKVEAFQLDYVQLHGTENPAFCEALYAKGIKIIKAFAVFERFEFSLLNHYKPFCEYFLFDTKGKLPGGNGEVFNWNLLQKYDNEVPYFLSGGIELRHVDFIQKLSTKFNIHSVDINSRFELEPGLKDIEKVDQFITDIRKSVTV